MERRACPLGMFLSRIRGGVGLLSLTGEEPLQGKEGGRWRTATSTTPATAWTTTPMCLPAGGVFNQ